MNKRCELCGFELSPEGACDNCGKELVISGPKQGVISVDLSTIQGDTEDLLRSIDEYWRFMEEVSVQLFFSPQEIPRMKERFTLLGTDESWGYLQKKMSARYSMPPDWITFKELPEEEVNRLKSKLSEGSR